MSDATSHRLHRAVGRPRLGAATRTPAVWREQALAEIASRRAVLERLVRHADEPLDAKAAGVVRESLDAAQAAAEGDAVHTRRRLSQALRGAAVERTWGQLDAAEEALLQAAPDAYVVGQLPRLLRRVHSTLDPDDPRRLALDEIGRRHGVPATAGGQSIAALAALAHRAGDDEDADRALAAAARAAYVPRGRLCATDREVILTAFHAANCESRRRQTRVRSFRNLLFLCAAVLCAVAILIAAFGFVRPELVPVCFQPSGQVVCPTRMKAMGDGGGAAGQPQAVATPRDVAAQDQTARGLARGVDIALIELVGLIAAAVAAAAAVREMRGTSTPYGVPLALAVLKLPTGAITAVLGLLLMRGQFVPGLTALDSPAQIVAWAIVFGYAQQLFTRFVDQRAQTVLEGAGQGEPAQVAGSSRAGAPHPATA